MTDQGNTRREAFLKRLHDLAPDRAINADASDDKLERTLAYVMERHLWTCPCGNGGELTINTDFDIGIYNDEGERVACCPACDFEYDLAAHDDGEHVALVPMLVWHVAQAGVFVIVGDDGDVTSVDDFEAEMEREAELSRQRGGSAVVTRYRPFTDPAEAVKAATRRMLCDPDDLIQIIPEALSR